MARTIFYYISVISLALTALIYTVWQPAVYFLLIIIPYILIGIFDILSKRHNILRNYPVVGHLRYMLEYIRPQIQQYFIASNQSERPFNREARDLVYRRAKGVRNTMPFGTQKDITRIGYEFSHHSLSPVKVSLEHARIVIGGDGCKKPYNASRLNISALSFGAISPNAISALNKGAKRGGFAHNTGEGGLTDYHINGGGDIIWQIGTGYYQCRNNDGTFSPKAFAEKSTLDNVKMIELKLSQGAKPAHGSLLPSIKVNHEVAKIRCVGVGEDSVSPPKHSAFSNPIELLEFIAKLRELSGGKPVGFKLCLGVRKEFMGICKAMIHTGITPDFITIDGAEGGTGAAPVEFTNSLGTPINEAIAFVHNCLVGTNIRDKIKIIASGKVVTGYDIVTKIAIGADMCNSARSMMFALGCLQSMQCNTNKCPTGIATIDERRVKGLCVEDKYIRVANFHAATISAFLQLVGAIGVKNPDELSPHHIRKYTSNEISRNFAEIFHYLKNGELLIKNIHSAYADDWKSSSAESF